MHWCRDHAAKIQQYRANHGLMNAPLRLEFVGVDMNEVDGIVCPICKLQSQYACGEAEGRFLVSIRTGEHKPYLLTD
jgi:hypothetical protein